MEMYEILKLAFNLKYYRDENELTAKGYKFYEGRSFQCGDYIKIRLNANNPFEEFLFYGECCKCCMAATEYVLNEYNKNRKVVSEKDLCDFFGEKMVHSRRECFLLPIKVFDSIRGGQ